MNIYCELAKQAVEAYTKKQDILDVPQKLPAEFKKKAGVFVTIYNGKELRGCIGTYQPTKPNLAKEIIDNAISAATSDWRFSQITKEELLELSYEVSVLEKPEQIEDIKKLDPKKFGIIVQGINARKSALLLPNLDGLDTIEKQLSACCQKAGINPTQEQIVIFRFQTEKYN
jgi:AmmeMemoRadiSam system protein A